MNHPRGSCFRPRPTALAGFLIASLGASVGGWDLKGFCWGVWISALATSLAAVVVSEIRALFVRPAAVRRFFDSSAWFRREIAPLPTPILWAMQAGAATLFAFIMVRVILFLFGFYGVFLSFFAESEPVELFGRNGFVNSDFITPTLFLLGRYWPMVVGGALTDLGPVFRVSPWRGFVRPFSQALAPLHVFVLVMPFVALLFFCCSVRRATRFRQ